MSGLYKNYGIVVCTSNMEHSDSLVTKSSHACQWKSANRHGIQHFCKKETLEGHRRPKKKNHLKIKLLPKNKEKSEQLLKNWKINK